ncbi:double-strand break repair helicase AddA [Pararhizobium mangrovi]|uniref:DNA 3'-5' helicase n=1 Tax=Pararhizobium mangrovi TaxID=2590452 RepID=A0A506U4L4_9HYPH|nr:double-strand break repair helicase AddA [Pararhizobium mangrovi]TPW28398.1 double-strand break repair helicase AddA [Pararhizobium mangrovi]
MTDETIPLVDRVAAEQARASDPFVSAWVSANAGSGKTHVLSQRVIRLLLEGCRPSAILCLTYTKAAAAEMANRVFARLSEWTRLDDETLAERISAVEGRTPGPERLLVARRLFAHALETPGGLKIQTIHAFCESLLHQFPLEANVAGHFEVLDEPAAAALLAEARRTLLTAAAGDEDAALAGALDTVLEAGEETGLENLLTLVVANREPIRRFLGFAEQHGGASAVLGHAFDLEPEDDIASIAAAAWPLDGLAGQTLEAYHAAANSQKAKKALEFSDALRAVERAAPSERWRMLEEILLTSVGEPRKLSQVTPKGVLEAMPDAEEMVERAQAHFLFIRDRLARLGTLRVTTAALTLAHRLDHEYERLKRERGRLDFDDLVNRTGALLDRAGAGAWVHYKLDQGIDHILVDEAQDTSPAQWRVIRALSDDFFSGAGARGSHRTLFAVGDEKQSIYSFQGARPERFDAERRDVERRVGEAGMRFEPVRLHVSFRSTADVLATVDHVFAHQDSRRGLGETDAIVHETSRQRHPGSVDVWEMIHKEPAEEKESWLVPFDAEHASAPPAKLARRVATTLADWIGRRTIVDDGKTRTVRPGDVLVLVRKRDAFVQALSRELKERVNVPVAGADRLKLAEHIAVQDLAALARVMLLPQDDLSLAAVLKSPLFSLTEEDLYTLAGERRDGESVYTALARHAADERPPFAQIHAQLEAWRGLVDRLPVFEFFARILAEGGRARMLARLGNEASDVLDAFLSFALDHEGATVLPGMQAFLAVLETDSPEIKREMDKGRDEVRIMTVHAAKGLEAPVVFLVDSGGDAVHTSHLPALRALPLEDRYGAAAPPAFVWVPGKAYENTLTTALRDAIRAAGEEEYRRLLYVALTRAADRLVVCGYQNPDDPKYRFWQGMVWEALSGEAVSAEPTTYTAGAESWSGLRFALSAAREADAPEAPTPEPAPPPPEALARPVPAPKRLPRPLSPSGASALIDGDEPEPPPASPLTAAAPVPSAGLERGRLVHRLLQVLPSLPADERSEAAERYMARAWPTRTAEERTAVIAPVLAILRDAAFAPVFARGSRAEISIMGTLSLAGRDHAVSGRIDRLSVDGDRVLIVDYKTNRPPHTHIETVPEAYKAQLAIYREILRPLYPEKRIEAALLFTEAPMLLPLEAGEMDAALAALAAP